MTDVLDAPACQQYHLFETTCRAFECAGDPDIELSAHFAHTEPHCDATFREHCAAHCPRFKCAQCNVRNNDTQTCIVCNACIDDCCACWTCGGCDNRSANRYCDNCDRCPDCCECPFCEACENHYTSVCANCEQCAKCCECVRCGACCEKYAADSLCAECCRCENCGCGCEDDCNDEDDNDASGSSLPHDTDSYRSSQSRTLSSDPDAVDAFARKRGTIQFPFLGAGASKDVYDLGDGYVLKVHNPRSNFGNQVKKECVRWSNAEDNQRVYMAPIIAHAADYRWAIQPKADCDAYKPYNVVDTIANALPWGDFHGANIALLGDRWVAIDYGY